MSEGNDLPPRVLHVVESLNRGAVENWLVRMLRHGVARNVAMDWTFYCVSAAPGERDEKANRLGARIVRSPVPIGRKLRFISALRQEIRSGQYDVLHCHHDLISALYLFSSLGLPVGRRIVHVHNADEAVLTPNLLKQTIFRPVLRSGCLAMADRVVGISNHTLDTFLSGRKRRPGRDAVHYYGVDASRFEGLAARRCEFRKQLSLPEDSKILLFAGRLVPEKNPTFAIDVLAELRRLEPAAVGVFAGTGALENDIRVRAEQLGVWERVRMLGWRDDLAQIMSDCDWFILPRPEAPPEGFGLAVVEAQLAGLRLLLSRGIPDDPLLAGARYRRLGLTSGARAWAKAASELLQEPPPARAEAIEALRNSPMAMDEALRGLLRLHGHKAGIG